jgi:hypothetical protein
MTQSAQEIYRSSNGDRWTLISDTGSGRVSVRHEFLSVAGSGPEFAALRRLINRAADPVVPSQ